MNHSINLWNSIDVLFMALYILQMTKLAIIPFTVLLETLFLKKQFRLYAYDELTDYSCS